MLDALDRWIAHVRLCPPDRGIGYFRDEPDPLRPDDHAVVFEALDNAERNGYELWNMADRDVALDLGTYCPELEGIEPDVLIPHIQAWKQLRHGTSP